MTTTNHPKADPCPRGIRNNNPGNIRKSAIAWQGGTDGDDPEFVTFSAPVYGIRAIAKVLLGYAGRYHLLTPKGIISRWAPPCENATAAYADDVAHRLGVGPDQPVAVDHPEVLKILVAAIIRHECGRQPYADDLLGEGVAMALARPIPSAA